MEVVSYNRYASFVRRFIAFVIDAIIIRIGIALLIGHFGHVDLYEVHNLFNSSTIISELLIMAYFVFCESSSWQATLGKRLLGIKVVDQNLSRISVQTAVIRYLCKYISGLILLLGFIWIIFDSRKQGWHDKLAQTFVIEN